MKITILSIVQEFFILEPKHHAVNFNYTQNGYFHRFKCRNSEFWGARENLRSDPGGLNVHKKAIAIQNEIIIKVLKMARR
jgi:hypothetical protein